MVEIIHDREALASLQNDWNRLAMRFQSPLLRHEWFMSCVYAFSYRQKPAVFIVRNHGAVEAIAPLATVRGVGMSSLEVMGASVLGEPCGFLFKDRRSLDELFRAIVSDGRPVHLDRMMSDCPELKVLDTVSSEERMFGHDRESRSPWLPIAGDWKSYEKSISSSRRSSLRRAYRRAAEAGTLTFEIVSPGNDELDPYFEEVVSVEAAGWKEKVGTSMNANAALRNFFWYYAHATARMGILRLGFAKMNGTSIAVLMGVQYAQKFWVLKIGFDEQWAKCSPGNLLMHETIRWSFERGLRAFEFLGNEEIWIHIWTDLSHIYQSQSVYPLTVRGVVSFGIDLPRMLMQRAASARRKIAKQWHGKFLQPLRQT